MQQCFCFTHCLVKPYWHGIINHFWPTFFCLVLVTCLFTLCIVPKLKWLSQVVRGVASADTGGGRRNTVENTQVDCRKKHLFWLTDTCIDNVWRIYRIVNYFCAVKKGRVVISGGVLRRRRWRFHTRHGSLFSGRVWLRNSCQLPGNWVILINGKILRIYRSATRFILALRSGRKFQNVSEITRFHEGVNEKIRPSLKNTNGL